MAYLELAESIVKVERDPVTKIEPFGEDVAEENPNGRVSGLLLVVNPLLLLVTTVGLV